MAITKISAVIFGGSGRMRPAEQDFALICFFLGSRHSLEIGSNKLVETSCF